MAFCQTWRQDYQKACETSLETGKTEEVTGWLSGRYLLKFKNLGYHWVQGTEKFQKLGTAWYWVPMKFQKNGYRWVPGTEEI